ncbi:MAG: glycosyltransferase [Methanoculleus marisnigri]|nr:glycosyltransferase [Methanoculleus marisnigri]
MRIVIDLQGAQSTGSRTRGIGRYSLSLAQAIVRNRGGHEVFIALNNQFPDTIEHIRATFDGLLPQDNIRVWTVPGRVSAVNTSNTWKREAAERLREAFLASLHPDVVLVSSLFEGLNDDSVTSVGVFSRSIPTAVTLYDLIPFIHPQPYLENPTVRNWYLKKIDHLRRADLWLAISESSRQEGIDYLGLPDDGIINISTAADDHFRKISISPEDEQNLYQKYGLARPFLMYTGGIDHRKNVERLINAFARLPDTIRRTHQLTIICSMQPGSRRALETLAKQQGLKPGDMIITGFVPEEDLVALYNLCKLFIFPSWHEGFGLPALEAMRCGAPVIAANTSSLPEVIGREDALFDPFSENSIAAKITEVLANDAFREELIRHGAEQAAKFSWDESARRTLAAIEQLHVEHRKSCTAIQLPARRPKLAYISPLPPERSGIADYSAELLPELARYYDIDVIVAQSEVSTPWIKACLPIRTIEWFVQHVDRYDRILYHFGNSLFHQHMFDLLDRIPGVVVLHDFSLSSIKAHLELSGCVPGAWTAELYKSHGYAAVWERFQEKDIADTIFKYPCNISVLQQAAGVIVHSAYSIELAQKWYEDRFGDNWWTIPLLRIPANKKDRIKARKILGLAPDDFVVCSFGILSSTKQNHRLLGAWLNSKLAEDPRCQLIFVGENGGGDYGKQLLDTIRQSGLRDRIHITGWVKTETFKHYLATADMAVQLRTHSRGETSAAILDCMNYGLPAVVNANGSIAELPQDAVWMLADDFEDADLIEALEVLRGDVERCKKLGARARKVIQTRHAPHVCAEQYALAIETFYASTETGKQALIDALARLEGMPSDEGTLATLATAITQNLPSKLPAHQLLVDVSGLMQHDSMSATPHAAWNTLRELLHNPPTGYRVEPIYFSAEHSGYHYARDFTMRFMACPSGSLADDLIETHPGDVFLGLASQTHAPQVHEESLKSLRLQGVWVYFVIHDTPSIISTQANPGETNIGQERWLNTIARFDGVLCTSHAAVGELMEWLESNGPKRLRPLKIGWFHLGEEVENFTSTRDQPNDTVQVLAQRHPRSDDVSWQTREQSTRQLLDLILQGKWCTEWRGSRSE